MTLPTHRVAYQVEYDILDKAVGHDLGARIRMPSIEAASHLRARIHQARKIDRNENLDLYDPGEPMHGQSIYDKLVCKIKDTKGKVYLYIEQRNAENFEVEFLEPDEPQRPPMQVAEVVVTEPLKRRAF
jgi:hypothetical protein